MRARNVVSWIISIAMVGAGVALIASFFFAGGRQTTASNEPDPGGFNVPELGTTQGAPDEPQGPQDTTLKLTVPKMSRVENAEIPNASGTDTEALDSNTAIHLDGTGYPWQEEPNVYIAGHRLGYPNSNSFLAFYDLNVLENGDEVIVTDAAGTEYTYRVFRNQVVKPTDLSVTKPVPGKNVLTLQTCTLPDYSERLVVQAELVDERA